MDIEEIEAANAEAGKFWFSPRTREFFGVKVETEPVVVVHRGKPSYAWIESTNNFDASARQFKIAVFDQATANIDWWTDGVNDRPIHDSLEEAQSFFDRYVNV